VQVDQQNNILSHEEILEEEKDNQFSLGKKLRISDEEFEDLDEVIARYVEPMVRIIMITGYTSGVQSFITCYFPQKVASIRSYLANISFKATLSQSANRAVNVRFRNSLVSMSPKIRSKYFSIDSTWAL
jgi:hypothetical protein